MNLEARGRVTRIFFLKRFTRFIVCGESPLLLLNTFHGGSPACGRWNMGTNERPEIAVHVLQGCVLLLLSFNIPMRMAICEVYVYSRWTSLTWVRAVGSRGLWGVSRTLLDRNKNYCRRSMGTMFCQISHRMIWADWNFSLVSYGRGIWWRCMRVSLDSCVWIKGTAITSVKV